MRYPFLLIALTAFLSIPAHGQKPKAADQLSHFIPDLMDRADVPGLSIALIDDGKIAWIGSFGVTKKGAGERVQEQTVFQAASLSKPVFAYAVLKLADAGKLDL